MKAVAGFILLFAVSAQAMRLSTNSEGALIQAGKDEYAQYGDFSSYEGDTFEEEEEELPLAPFFILNNPLSLLMRELALQQFLEDSAPAEPAIPADAMLSQVAHARFVDAMSDCEKMHVLQGEAAEEPVMEMWIERDPINAADDTDTMVWPRSMTMTSDGDDAVMSAMTMWSDVLNRLFDVTPQEPRYGDEEDVVDEGYGYSTMTVSPVDTTIIIVDNSGPLYPQTDDWTDQIAARMANEQWKFEQQQMQWRNQFLVDDWPQQSVASVPLRALPDDHVPSVADMLLLSILLMGAAVVLANLVYNWLQLRATMAGPEPSSGMVQVMFQHNGQLVRGYMALSDLEQPSYEKGSDKPTQMSAKTVAPSAETVSPKEGGIVVAADMV